MTPPLTSSSHRYATPLTVELALPPHVVLFAMGMHALAGFALLAAAIPCALSAAGIALLLASLHLVMFRLCFYRRAVWRADGTWLLVAQDGRTHVMALAADSVALPYAAVLNFDSLRGAHSASVLVLPTAANAQALRRLRVRLRVEGHAPQR